MPINCPFRSDSADGPLCRIVAEVTDLPLELCKTNDSACDYCIQCGIAPQTPNGVVASMALAAQVRAKVQPSQEILRVIPRESAVKPTLDNTPCVFRNQQTREVECKPCQTGDQPPLVPVYRCNSGKRSECTLMNTGLVPKIQGCVTCPDRLPEYPRLVSLPTPETVLAAMQAK